MKADYLCIDDNKTRVIAESMDINCIGSVGLLMKAKKLGLINNLKLIFEIWLENERYFSKILLNQILLDVGETPFS